MQEGGWAEDRWLLDCNRGVCLWSPCPQGVSFVAVLLPLVVGVTVLLPLVVGVAVLLPLVVGVAVLLPLVVGVAVLHASSGGWCRCVVVVFFSSCSFGLEKFDLVLDSTKRTVHFCTVTE